MNNAALPLDETAPASTREEIFAPQSVVETPVENAASTRGGETARERIKKLIENTRAARPASDSDLLMRAYDFAQEKHAPQKRMTGEPYIEHPIAVAGILAELGMDDPTLAAGLLHDVVEDCAVDFEEMTRRFGAEVAQLVDGVTKLKQIDFSSKQEKQAENLRKLFLAMAGDVRVIIIKLADRLHNMRTLDPFPEERKREIAAETLHIFAPIAHRLGIWRIKWELEDRSFKYLEPAAYKTIYAGVQKTRAERDKYVGEAISTLQEKLKAEGIQAEVTGRPKHFYSIYQKMQQQDLEFAELYDLIALRVITGSLHDCYHALGVVHSLWTQLPEKFYDYISQPKANNYKSIHTKVRGAGGQPIEVQIRTREMHREADFGIAAHWRYKEGAGGQWSNDDNVSSKLKWLRLVLELESDTTGDAQSFLDSLKLDLNDEHLFAFTPRGDVIYLPPDATPVDFAYRVHSDVGNTCVGARVNNRIVPLDYKLHNGDICEIMTAREGKAGVGPKRGWLEFVATQHARNRIKSFLKKQNREENVREGTERLEAAARAEKVRLGKLDDNEALLEQARSMSLKSVDDLLAAIGYGEYSAETVLRRARAQMEKSERAPRKRSASTRATSVTANALPPSPRSALARAASTRGAKSSRENSDGEAVEAQLFRVKGTTARRRDGASTREEAESEARPGVAKLSDDLLFSLARCCAPIPGDEVRGYVTRGRGVTVHRADCANLRHYETREPDRLMDIDWDESDDRLYRALVAIESRDRLGLLHDVTSAISENKINIHAVNTYPLKDSRARLNIAVNVSGKRQLQKIIDVLCVIEGINDVHRV